MIVITSTHACTIDQELTGTAAYMRRRRFVFSHGRHFESVTSNRKSDSVDRYVIYLKTFLSNLIPIRLETMEP